MKYIILKNIDDNNVHILNMQHIKEIEISDIEISIEMGNGCPTHKIPNNFLCGASVKEFFKNGATVEKITLDELSLVVSTFLDSDEKTLALSYSRKS